MGESAACLVRSFSQPSPTSGEEKKGNPIQRALTASVSFGRFMSESLDWGKWSAFTSNRHVEEAEKHSKPGSVAEKKAYFEAHFKRRRAAALLANHIENDLCNDGVVSGKEKESVVRNSASGEKAYSENRDKMIPQGKHSAKDSSNKRRSYSTSRIDISSALTNTDKNSVVPQMSTTASTNRFKHYSDESKRAVKPHGESVSQAKGVDKNVPSMNSNYSKPSSLHGNRPRVSTLPSSFTFKNEERAEKRRGEMLQQKGTRKNQMHAKSEVRRRSRDMDFCNSVALETTKAPLRNITKKHPSFRKIEERVPNSNIIRPPWRLSAKSEGLKHSTKCLPKKHMSENASPHVQL